MYYRKITTTVFLLVFNVISYPLWAGRPIHPFYYTQDLFLPHCYIYGYTDNMVVADIENALISEVAYTSFEDNTTGNWTFNANGIGSVSGVKALTGDKFYTLSAGNISKTFSPSPGKNIVVSYWSRSGPQYINGSSAAQSGRSVIIGQYTWTFYEQVISNPTAITISGSGVIDELRLYPEESSMTTYTYLPFVGVATKCDINNNIIYYEYDIFNRVSIIKDQDQKVVKKYCYGNPGQTENCSGLIFQSELKSANFQRSDCGSGYVGSSVTYTVPYGTYVSSVDQATANQMAQADLDANGQLYANINGMCGYIYYNPDFSGNYYNMNCNIGETPAAIYVSVPANMFSSFVSQSDANNQALQYAQNYANQNGQCVTDVLLTCDNEIGGVTMHVVLTSLETNDVYYFESNGFSELGTIPAGHYDVEITSDCGWCYCSFMAGCDYETSGYSAYFYDVSFDNSCNYIYIF